MRSGNWYSWLGGQTCQRKNTSRPALHIGRSPGDVPRRSPKKVKNYTLCGNWKNFRCYRLIWTRWRRCYPQKRSQKARTCLKLIFVFTAKNTHKHEISILSMFLTFESVSVCSIVSSGSKLVGSNGKFFQFPQRVQFFTFLGDLRGTSPGDLPMCKGGRNHALIPPQNTTNL